MTYFRNIGVALDILLNVLFGGALGQTISLRAATAASKGSRPGCAVCAMLAILVQRNHCKLTLEQVTTPLSAALRSVVLLILLAAFIWNIPAIVFHIIAAFA